MGKKLLLVIFLVIALSFLETANADEIYLAYPCKLIAFVEKVNIGNDFIEFTCLHKEKIEKIKLSGAHVFMFYQSHYRVVEYRQWPTGNEYIRLIFSDNTERKKLKKHLSSQGRRIWPKIGLYIIDLK